MKESPTEEIKLTEQDKTELHNASIQNKITELQKAVRILDSEQAPAHIIIGVQEAITKLYKQLIK